MSQKRRPSPLKRKRVKAGAGTRNRPPSSFPSDDSILGGEYEASFSEDGSEETYRLPEGIVIKISKDHASVTAPDRFYGDSFFLDMIKTIVSERVTEMEQLHKKKVQQRVQLEMHWVAS